MAAENDIFLNLNPIDESNMEWQEAFRIFQRQMLQNLLQLKYWQEKQYEDNTTYVGTGTDLSDHIADTDNPHSTTKTHIGLSNVTDDAQLKREAGDINTFTEKSSPVSADLILIEDSADSNNKKKVQAGNLPVGSGFGKTAVEITTDSDAVDVSGAADLVVVKANTGSNNITIGGLSGGQTDQLVVIYKSSSSNTLTIEHNESTGTEKIITKNMGDISLTSYGGVLLYFQSASSEWFVIDS